MVTLSPSEAYVTDGLGHEYALSPAKDTRKKGQVDGLVTVERV